MLRPVGFFVFGVFAILYCPRFHLCPSHEALHILLRILRAINCDIEILYHRLALILDRFTDVIHKISAAVHNLVRVLASHSCFECRWLREQVWRVFCLPVPAYIPFWERTLTGYAEREFTSFYRKMRELDPAEQFASSQRKEAFYLLYNPGYVVFRTLNRACDGALYAVPDSAHF